MPYQRSYLHDEAVQLLVRGDETIPASVSSSDVGTFAGIDDRFYIKAYHRVIETSEEADDGYGDGDNQITETTEMLMVVTNNREFTDIKGVDLARYIKAGFRTSLTNAEINTTGISQVLIEVGSTNLNTQSVVEEEYTDLRNLPPNYDVFAITYEIQMKIDKNCLALCEA